MKFLSNIKVRLSFWYLLILVLILIFFSIVTYFMLEQSLFQITQSDSRLSVLQANASSDSPDAKLDAGWLDNPQQPSRIISYTISKEWLSKLQSEPSSTLSVYTPTEQITINQKAFITPDMTGEQNVRLYLRPSLDNPGSYDVFAIVRPVSEVNKTLAAFLRILFIAVPVTTIIAVGFGFFLIWRMLKPVNEITKTAREIGETDLNRRIPVKSNDELGSLASTLNQTFSRLQKAFDRERQFTSDASHELRTPLAIIQSEATVSLSEERPQAEYRKSLEIISQEITHMSSMVNKLLVLARGDSGKESVMMSSIDLKDFLSEMASDIEVLCEDKSLHFKPNLPETAKINGDKVKLRELFLNLVDNAVRYTPPGGTIMLTLTKDKYSAQVAVRDTGIGIPEENLPHIFERFYRVNKSRAGNDNGTGLGLAICKHIAEMHKGSIRVFSRAGEGSTFFVSLPLLSE